MGLPYSCSNCDDLAQLQPDALHLPGAASELRLRRIAATARPPLAASFISERLALQRDPIVAVSSRPAGTPHRGLSGEPGARPVLALPVPSLRSLRGPPRSA